MADTTIASGSDAPIEETPNQRQARLRREKMKKKMAESGEDRLSKIKALNGGVAPPTEALGGPAVPVAAKSKPATAQQAFVEDPDEVDIDTISGTGTPHSRGATQNDDFSFGALQQQQMFPPQGNASGGEDPMVQMMQQLQGMMGGMGGNPQDPNNQNGPADMLQSLLGGGGMPGQTGTQAPPTSSSTYIWRIIHAVFAFALALYITLTLSFDGSKFSRSQQIRFAVDGVGGVDSKTPPKLLWIFVTAELGLQSARYFLEKGQLQGNGMLAKIANSGFVPEPYAGYIRIAGRYVGIFQTTVADIMIMIFVFGIMAWWQGMVEV